MLYKSGNNLFSGALEFISNSNEITLFSAYIKTEQLIKLDALKKIGDDSVDCVITSPPYNIGYKQGAMGTDLKGHLYGYENYDFIDENEYQSWMVQVLDELHRIVKPTGSLFFNHKDRTKITVKRYGQ